MTYDLTKEQRTRKDAAKNEIQRKLQQMISSGQHDASAVRWAVAELLEAWR